MDHPPVLLFGIGALIAILLTCVPATASPLKLLFSGYAEERYDDNVLFTTRPVEDYITIAAPRLGVQYLTERTDLNLAASLTHYSYRDNPDLDNLDQRYNGSWRGSWSERFQSTIDAAFMEDENRNRVLEESGLLTDESKRRRWDTTLGGRYALSERNYLTASYAFLSERYDDPSVDDLVGHVIQSGFQRSLGAQSERTTAFFQLAYSVYEYTNHYSREWILEPISVESERDIQTWSGYLGVDHRWTERLTLNASAGARYSRYEMVVRQGNRYVSFEETDEFDPWGFVGALGLNYQGLYTRGGVSLNHDLAPASGRNRLTERTSLRLDGGWRPASEWTLGAGAAAFLNRSEETGAASDIDELSASLTANVRYEFNRQWSLGLRYSFYWIDDRENDIERRRNTLALMLGWSLPIWE